MSRLVICSVVVLALGSYFLQPVGWLFWTLDLFFRTYLHFVAGAMAHEGTHGHLGNSPAANRWWGRLALVPTTVPYVSFRLTHLAHHRYTNVPGKDPDEFLNTPHTWQIPFRALAMPHHWLVWLKKRKMLPSRAIAEYVLTYAVYVAIYGAIASQVGISRVLWGLLPAAILHSFLLWYPFAIKTHEGYSTADADTRSHDYRGRFAFWFSFGLSLHRVHHLRPNLGWLQMAPMVPPCSWWEALTFRRDVRNGV